MIQSSSLSDAQIIADHTVLEFFTQYLNSILILVKNACFNCKGNLIRLLTG